MLDFVCMFTLLVFLSTYRAWRSSHGCGTTRETRLGWLPYIGNMWTISGLQVNPGRTCQYLHEKFGDFAVISVGSWPAILINSPEVANDLLQKVANTRRRLQCLNGADHIH